MKKYYIKGSTKENKGKEAVELFALRKTLIGSLMLIWEMFNSGYSKIIIYKNL